MATTSEQYVKFEGKTYGYYCRITYEAGNGTVKVTKIEMHQDQAAHDYRAFYGYEQTATLKVGDTTHSITKDYITRNSTSWFTSAEGSWSGNGSGAADITWTCKARSSAPNMLTFSWSVDPGYPAPSEVTLTNVTTDIGTATVSVYIKGSYTEVQYSKDGSTWQSSNVFNDLTHNQRYTFYARARNNSSSWTTSGGYSVTIPGNAPTITSVSTSLTRTTCDFTINVNYDTNASFKSRSIQYGTTTSYGSSTTDTSINGLTANTKYYYEITVTDNKNKTSSAYTGDFTTTHTAPSIGTIVPTVGDNTCSFPTSGSGITYDNASYANATIKYRVAGTSSWATLTTSASPALLSGLDIVTTYEYEYTITDNGGGVSNTVTGTFTTTGQSKARIKVNGTWRRGRVFFKKNGEWVVSKKIFTKKNGEWVETKN